MDDLQKEWEGCASTVDYSTERLLSRRELPSEGILDFFIFLEWKWNGKFSKKIHKIYQLINVRYILIK